MKYEIIKYGRPELRKKSRKVERIDESIRQLVKDMYETMKDNNGLGLAAEQIGRTESVCIIDIPPESMAEAQPGDDLVSMPMVLINPEITLFEGEQTAKEGCLSFPDIYIRLKRAKTVEVRYMDLDGLEKKARLSGLAARAVQHELDHLNGILLVDRMSAVQKVANSSKLKKLKKSSSSS